MQHLTIFNSKTDLISKFGEGNAYLLFAMGLYLDCPDLNSLGSECLTDGSNDRKIDFIKYDKDLRRIIFAQGYYSKLTNDRAKSNKAADLNTASAWLLHGDLADVPENLRSIIEECRIGLSDNEVDQIDILYVHNLPESINVTKELLTASQYLENSLKEKEIVVSYKELGLENIENIFLIKESSLSVTENIICPAKVQYIENGPNWKAYILSVPGPWLREIFIKYQEELFSANYRGFLGATKRRKINTGIRTTAEKTPDNFWVYNNGITILTSKVTDVNGILNLQGISIINGAQTTGSIGSLDSSIELKTIKVLARVIECYDSETVKEIVKYNNTQNKITTWDRFSNDPVQRRIEYEFKQFNHIYSLKRGFGSGSEIGIEVAAQPTVAFEGYFVEANSGKNSVFESDKMYRIAFEEKKAKHLLLTMAISFAIDERRNELKNKSNNGTILDLEKKQLNLLRNLRFKYFFIAVLGKCMDVILDKRVDISQIGFKHHYCIKANKHVIELVAEVLPLIKVVLTYASSYINGDLSEYIRTENALGKLSENLKSAIYAQESVGSSPALESFRKIIE